MSIKLLVIWKYCSNLDIPNNIGKKDINGNQNSAPMKKQVFKVLLIVLVIIYIGGCKPNSSTPCPPQPDTIVYNIRSDIESLIPYSGIDTLRFMHNDTSLHIFVGKGKQYSYYDIQPPWETCESDVLRKQQYIIIYEDIITKHKIYFNHYIETNSNVLTNIRINFLGRSFDACPSLFYPPYPFEQFFIGNKQYKQVFLIPKIEIRDTVYYTINEGIIKFGFRTGDKWEIVQ